MSETIETLRQRAVDCRLLAETALTEDGRNALIAIADDYNRRLRKLAAKSATAAN